MEKKILIAFDDSENSMKAVEVVGDTFTKDHKITILSIIPDTVAVCNMYSPELTPHFMTQQDLFCAMEEKNKSLLKDAQEKAKKVLLAKGFSEEDITQIIKTTQRGIARDIIHEAQSGYDVIALGRRGISGIKEFFLGSVSSKVVSMSKGVSILVVE
ncbi:MAG: universal stress protein [Deltaproteobacteria bacterium]|nr:universal stress protein [Deltaproteobacteria bacterium]